METSLPFTDHTSDARHDDLISRARQGQCDALNELIVSMRSYLLLIANEELDREIRAKVAPSDIVQNVLLKAQANIGDFRGQTQAAWRGWLRKMVRNEILSAHRHFHARMRDVHRETRRDSKLPGGHPSDQRRSPQSSLIWAEDVAVVREALSLLSEDYRTVIYLRTWQQLPFETVGERMDRSAEAAKKLWQRAIAALQKELPGEP